MIKEEIEKKKKRKKSIWFAASFVASFILVQVFFSYNTVEKRLQREAEEINKSCPMKLDNDLTLDNAKALPNKTFQYNYTVNHEKSEIIPDTVKKYLFPSLLENIKTNPDLESFRDHDIIFNYHYVDKKGAFVIDYTITPEMYSNQSI